jgi:putative transcriptional regulator
MNSYEGNFLVADRHQLDPNFAGMVILVVEHSLDGAFGVIVNCPRKESRRLQQCNFGWRSSKTAISSFGGPVTGPLMAVHTKASLGERQLLPGVFFSGKEKNVQTLIRQAEQPLKVFAGYAGWEAGQLEFEVELGIWRVAPATAEQTFSDSDELWEQVSRQTSRLQLQVMLNLKHIPADPLLN